MYIPVVSITKFAVLDTYRRHRQFKPRGIAELNEGGLKLAQALADEVAAVVDEVSGGTGPAGERQDDA